MCCYSCGPYKNSLEFQRRYKPQNNKSCGCVGPNNICGEPSSAIEGSPLYNWEQIYGKLIKNITYEQSPNGKLIQIVKKTTCPIIKKNRNVSCCSINYTIKY